MRAGDAQPADLRAVRELALAIHREIELDARFATTAMSSAFRRAGHLGDEERRLVAESVYGLSRWRAVLDALVAKTVPADRAAPGTRNHDLLRFAYLRVLFSGDDPRELGELLDRFRVAIPVLRAVFDDLRRDPALRHGLPSWLYERIRDDFGEAGLDALLASLNEDPPLAIRANTVRSDVTSVAERLRAEGVACDRGGIASHALVLRSRRHVFSTRAFREGLFEVQDEASQLVVELVAPPPGSTVLDACAGSGGKTLALACALGNRGRVLAHDLDLRKLDETKSRARRARLSNVETVRDSAALDLLSLPRVLVDAPCSGVGVLRRNPETRWRLTPSELDGLPALQVSILSRYARCVAPGGRLIYVTCSFLRAEDELVVARFLEEHTDFSIMTTSEILGGERARAIGDGRFLRTLPHLHGTDGFFGAVMRRGRPVD